MFLCCTATTFAQYSGSGSGTENDPYLIYNENQLSQISNFLNQEGVVFKLMKDLDLTNWIAENNPSQGWLPIGVESSPFKGVFYGNNHNISGLTINRKSTNNVGFFGYVTDATISNLTIEGTIVNGADNVGAMFGYISGSIVTNCRVMMTGETGVSGTTFVGGFAGYSSNTNYSTFRVNTSATSSAGLVGGFIGKVEGGEFANGSATGTVSIMSGGYTGGLFGKATNFTLNTINVKSDVIGKKYTGGITGYSANGNLTNCVYEGTISGTQYVGGIVGSLETTTSSFESCFSKGKITATGDYAGGIVGVSQGACIDEMESCSHFGDISGQSYVGGLIGAVVNTSEQPTLFTYSVYSGVSNGAPSGTLLQSTSETIVNGTTKTVPVNNCTAIGNIDGDSWLGGLLGSDIASYGYIPEKKSASYVNRDYYSKNLFKDKVYIRECRGNAVTLYYDYYVYSRNNISLALTNNYYSGTIQGTENVGGLVGYKSGGSIQYNYAYANIYGSSNVGGVVGQISANKESNSYNTTTLKSNATTNSTVSASASAVGRIYGFKDNDKYTIIGELGSAEGNLALVQTKVILQGVVQEVEDDLQNGTSIGPSLLKLKATYVKMGWDFDNNWNNLETECYPYKKYQAAPPIIKSNLVSKATSIKGQSLNGGTVYLFYKDRDAVSTTCEGNNWEFTTEALQSGALVQIYADVEGMTPSYYTTTNVGYPGSGTEEDPYRIYTAEDLQGASNRGYYKLMNDIDLTSWINENSPTEGWPAIGRNSGEATYIDGANHKVTGLWMNTTQNYNGLFSNFSAGQIKNLTVEVAKGKKVKGGDYTGILIGRNANGRLVNCTVKGDVEGIDHVGGVVGYAENTTISAVTAEANITGTLNVGGIAGQTLNCTMTTCNAITTIASSGEESKVGGLVGYAKGGSVSKCSAQNSLTAADETNYVGGLIGYSETPTSLSFSTGDVAATGSNSYSGGLVGYALSPIENCYSTANASGTQFTAGLVGYTFSSIDKCYAKGDVHGVHSGAGVVGELDGAGASLSNSVACCNILSLIGQSSWGNRVIGGFKNGAAEPGTSNYALSTMQVSVNNEPQKKTDDNLEGIAMAEAVLKMASTYTGLGWDMTNIWTIVEGEGYPTLKKDENNGGNEENPDDNTDDANTLFGSDLQTSAGMVAVLPVMLLNEDDVKLYQFDLQLPTGVTVAKKSNGKLNATLTERAESHSVTGKQLDNGDYRFVISSMDNESFAGNNGTLLEITLDVSATMEAGEYTVKVLNTELSVPNGNNLKVVKPADTKSKLIIKNNRLGDVNNDGEVSVTDVGCAINYILEQIPSVFIFDAADMNSDEKITVTDVGMIINVILNDGAASRQKTQRNVADAYLSLIPTTGGYQLMLENKDAFVAFQMDIQLANGATINGMRLNDNNNHQLIYRKLNNGKYRVVCYSHTNSTFTDNDFALLNISTTDDIIISDIRLTTAGLMELRPTVSNGMPTDIANVEQGIQVNINGNTLQIISDSDTTIRLYSLGGSVCRILNVHRGVNNFDGLRAGVYMIGNRKVILK